MKTVLKYYTCAATTPGRLAQQLFGWCVSFFMFLILAQGAAGAATVVTDKEDYPPYSVVYITGAGFQAGETVSNQVVQIAGPDAGAAYEPWGVVADTNGGFETEWLVFSDELLNTTLELTATGQSSGLIAKTTFADSIGGPSVAFPVNNTTYNTSSYNAGNSTAGGDIGGTVNYDNGSLNRTISVSIKRNNDNLYWNGSAFTSAAEVFNAGTFPSGSGGNGSI